MTVLPDLLSGVLWCRCHSMCETRSKLCICWAIVGTRRMGGTRMAVPMDPTDHRRRWVLLLEQPEASCDPARQVYFFHTDIRPAMAIDKGTNFFT